MQVKEETLTIEDCVMSLFLALDILPDKAGYRYLKGAVLGYLDGDVSMRSLNRRIAAMNRSSECSVEKSMRSALRISSCEVWRKTFGSVVGYRLVGKNGLTVKKFVAIVAEFLSSERNRRNIIALKTY